MFFFFLFFFLNQKRGDFFKKYYPLPFLKCLTCQRQEGVQYIYPLSPGLSHPPLLLTREMHHHRQGGDKGRERLRTHIFCKRKGLGRSILFQAQREPCASN